MNRHRNAPWSARQVAVPSESRMRGITRTIAAVGLVTLAVWVVRDFLTALTWAGLIAVTIWPIYRRFVSLMRAERDVLAPLLFTLLIGLILIIPLTAAMHQIALGSRLFASTLRELQGSGLPVPSWLAQLPMAGEYLDIWWRNNLGNPQNLREWLAHVNIESITVWARVLSGAVLQGLFHFSIMLLALFFFLRRGVNLAALLLIAAERLFGEPGARLAPAIADSVRATVNGTAVAALGKGLLVGIAYVICGVPHPLLFAGLTVASAMVPLGAWIVLIVAALMVPAYSGSWPASVMLFAVGAAVLLVGDNVVQPALIGEAAELPFLLVLIGMLGGLQSFGLIGLFLGPVVMATVLAVWREWIDSNERTTDSDQTRR
ncbi:AI-2E family transporter [Bradyrhizobium genosp. P]|uniref:AI-2E family transporter n=1 Tax=Bradyrhizobium genosp. P TaxID=83641 RepID=UPI003CEB770E